jgi:hypothetical protein
LKSGRSALLWSFVAVLVAALAVAGCGSSKKKSSSSSSAGSFNVTITDSGKQAKYTVPASIKGGLVNLVAVNHGKGPHSAQLIRIEGNHTVQEAIKIVSSNSNKTPEWLRAEGGVGTAVPGKPAAASLVLPAGKYAIGDFGNQQLQGPPGYTQFTVTAGPSGSLPSTPTTVTAANPGKDRYKWQISGGLKPGANTITFASKGKEALHLILAARITGKHSDAELVKALGTNGPPPSYVDQKSFTNTAALDGGKSQTLQFDFQRPGTYVLFCPFTDRDGGKQHLKEGLLTQVTIK